MSLPDCFCWTRFGTEAGEHIDRIAARKELERTTNHGIFLWGVGNALGPSIRRLIETDPDPEVVFSPIRSKPREEDEYPSGVVVWTAGIDLDGEIVELPSGSVVTSRATSSNLKRGHYALVCSSSSEVEMRDTGENVFFGSVRNLRTDRPVGFTQVTSVVRNSLDEELGARYPVFLRTGLVSPYFVELIDPLPLPQEARVSPELTYAMGMELIKAAKNRREEKLQLERERQLRLL